MYLRNYQLVGLSTELMPQIQTKDQMVILLTPLLKTLEKKYLKLIQYQVQSH